MSHALVALDLDGTLLGPDGAIRPEDRQAVAAAQRGGAQVVIATGRCFANAVHVARDLGLRGPLIGTTGAQVVDAASGRVLHERRLPAASAAAILAHCRDRGIAAAAYFDLGRDIRWVASPPAGYRWLREESQVRLQADLPERLAADPEQVLVLGRAGSLDVAAAFAGGPAQILALPDPARPNALHVLHPEGTKGAALAWLAAKLRVPRERVVAVGDSRNDLSMIAGAGSGFAMAGAPAEVASAARGVVVSVADALRRAGVI